MLSHSRPRDKKITRASGTTVIENIRWYETTLNIEAFPERFEMVQAERPLEMVCVMRALRYIAHT
jgi:hypothetical protein